MRTLIVAAALALGTLVVVSAPTAQAQRRGGAHYGYRGGHYGGYRGGFRSSRTLSRICDTIATMRARSTSMRSISVRDCSADNGLMAIVSSDSCKLASGVLN